MSEAVHVRFGKARRRLIYARCAATTQRAPCLFTVDYHLSLETDAFFGGLHGPALELGCAQRTATKVDFAQMVGSDSAGQIPAASYVSATLTIDYASASITADDGTGNGVALKPVAANCNVLTGTVQVGVQLDNTNPLVITAGRASRTTSS